MIRTTEELERLAADVVKLNTPDHKLKVKQNMKTTLREKLEEIDKECAECPPELAEAALGLIRLKLRDALQDVAKLEVYADIIASKIK
jgi:hypothetical protein